MNKLQDSISRMLYLEKIIYDNEGEIDSLTEDQIELAEKDIVENVEKTVFAYKNRVNEIQTVKDHYKLFLATRQNQLDKFKDAIEKVCERYGRRLQSPIASLGIVSRVVRRCKITHFDLVMEHYPDAVKVHTVDNVRTITLDKAELKSAWGMGDKGNGFEVVEDRISYPDIRLKSKARENDE